MSNLKHLSLEDLEHAKVDTEKYMSNLMNKYNQQQTRLEWINRYIERKTPVLMTIADIENKLGHKVTIVISE